MLSGEGGSPFQWRAADVDVDAVGRVRWASWVNHLDDMLHAPLLRLLEGLLEAALPDLECTSGHRLRARRLQVVVRAYEQAVEDADAPTYRVADWHIDGTPAERIIATAVSYLHVSPSLQGGSLNFSSVQDVFIDDLQDSCRVEPRTGTLVVFNNYLLRHRVDGIWGQGRRRMVAFHLVDPQHVQEPRASVVPRDLKCQNKPMLALILRPLGLAPRPFRLLLDFSAEGKVTLRILSPELDAMSGRGETPVVNGNESRRDVDGWRPAF